MHKKCTHPQSNLSADKKNHTLELIHKCQSKITKYEAIKNTEIIGFVDDTRLYKKKGLILTYLSFIISNTAFEQVS